MLYPLFLLCNALEMVFEWHVSARNSKALVRNGAIEIAPFQLPLMSLIYALMYLGSFFEFLIRRPHISALWGSGFLLFYAFAKGLKLWAVRSLGKFWTMKVLVISGSDVVRSGPYRYMRHPNYLAVLMEIAATPLLGKSGVAAISINT